MNFNPFFNDDILKLGLKSLSEAEATFPPCFNPNSIADQHQVWNHPPASSSRNNLPPPPHNPHGLRNQFPPTVRSPPWIKNGMNRQQITPPLQPYDLPDFHTHPMMRHGMKRDEQYNHKSDNLYHQHGMPVHGWSSERQPEHYNRGGGQGQGTWGRGGGHMNHRTFESMTYRDDHTIINGHNGAMAMDRYGREDRNMRASVKNGAIRSRGLENGGLDEMSGGRSHRGGHVMGTGHNQQWDTPIGYSHSNHIANGHLPIPSNYHGVPMGNSHHHHQSHPQHGVNGYPSETDHPYPYTPSYSPISSSHHSDEHNNPEDSVWNSDVDGDMMWRDPNEENTKKRRDLGTQQWGNPSQQTKEIRRWTVPADEEDAPHPTGWIIIHPDENSQDKPFAMPSPIVTVQPSATLDLCVRLRDAVDQGFLDVSVLKGDAFTPETLYFINQIIAKIPRFIESKKRLEEIHAMPFMSPLVKEESDRLAFEVENLRLEIAIIQSKIGDVPCETRASTSSSSSRLAQWTKGGSSTVPSSISEDTNSLQEQWNNGQTNILDIDVTEWDQTVTDGMTHSSILQQLGNDVRLLSMNDDLDDDIFLSSSDNRNVSLSTSTTSPFN